MSANKEQIKSRLMRKLEAYKLRQSGLTLQAVGDRLGVSREQARKMIAIIILLIDSPDFGSYYRKACPELFEDEVFKPRAE